MTESFSQFVDHLIYVLPSVLLLGLIILVCSPKLLLKVIAWFIQIVLLRVRVTGAENLPYSGPILLVSNHVSLLDLLMIQSVARQRVRFLVRTEIVDFIPTRFIFWYLGVIKVPNSRRPKEMKKFFEDIKNRLRKGETICFFPEGAISGSGNLMRFRSGVQSFIPQDVPVTVIPMRLGMLHGRLTGIHNNRLHLRPLTRWPVNYNITLGEPVDANLTAFQLRQKISELGAIAERLPQAGEVPLHTAFIFRAKKHPFSTTWFDASTGKHLSNFKMMMLMILLSKKIRQLDKGTDGYTGILMPNTPITAGVLMAILCADRTPAVVNFSAGEAVALDSARRAGVKTIFTSRKFLQKLKWQESDEMVCLEDVVPSITKFDKFKAMLMMLLPSRMLVRNLSPLSCYNMFQQAALIFSSGSTGKPKGVMLTQLNFNCDVYSMLRVIDWTTSDRVAGNLPLFHSFGFTVCFAMPAWTGTPVAYVSNPLDAATIVHSVKEFKLSIMAATPTFLQMYMMKAKPEDFRTLRLCITGAEKLRTELADRYRNMTGKDIIEGYGCTELSPVVSINLNNSIYTLGTKADHPGSIGCTLPGIHARIIDPDTGVELPPGREGKLQVRSGTVMKGYLHEQELTDQVIQNNYYDTGDIAKMDLDGYIYITGRASRFSKIGGEMVPHEGVEDAITRILHSEFREVAVSGRTDPAKGERLIVFYSKQDMDIPGVIAALRESGLPNIWIPKADDFFKVDELPLLGSGKLNLIKLKQMVSDLGK